MLERIQDAEPKIGDWEILKSRLSLTSLTIAHARENLLEWVENNGAMDEERPDPHYGFTLLARAGPTRSPKSISLSATVGGHLGDSIRFGVGTVLIPSDLEIVTYSLFRAVMQAIIMLWPPVWAIAKVYRRNYDKVAAAPGMPLFPASNYHMPWLAYLSEPLIAGLSLPPDLLSEHTVDDGLLMIAAEERLDPTNPEHMRRSREIMEIMVARAGALPLNGYAMGGKPWPKPRKRGA
jgi:hypothetical protein